MDGAEEEEKKKTADMGQSKEIEMEKENSRAENGKKVE